MVRSNPLGTQGNIAQRYGDLVKDLWSGTAKSIAPLKLRVSTGKYFDLEMLQLNIKMLHNTKSEIFKAAVILDQSRLQ